ncbi:protein-disulfide isomerase [Bradyrhizobium sp. CB1717]|uniref:DsbA family protein n=1 Tax=Bradyrhizobium sp. CB1717 TaxID=3039154 RepID=UPI0024B09A79|nr:protein-disulfide isomerase [Bradyrhizobium sp. CB1717]WFU23026.1 protein-disulfide isomerase [Bradyrhizobium sp. CB1717]
MTKAVQFHYFFDPLCGWCYASAPALAALDGAYPGAVQMMPSGLFADGNARAVSSMADHAWRNDMRISKLAGQRFTEAYRENVLLNPRGVFDSGPATRALVALGELSATLEPVFLHQVQLARYIEARDTSLPDEVAAVAIAVAREANFLLKSTDFALRLTEDEELAARANERIAETRKLMGRLSSSGVPQLLVSRDGQAEVIHGAPLYSGEDEVLRAVSDVTSRLTAASGE